MLIRQETVEHIFQDWYEASHSNILDKVIFKKEITKELEFVIYFYDEDTRVREEISVPKTELQEFIVSALV